LIVEPNQRPQPPARPRLRAGRRLSQLHKRGATGQRANVLQENKGRNLANIRLPRDRAQTRPKLDISEGNGLSASVYFGEHLFEKVDGGNWAYNFARIARSDGQDQHSEGDRQSVEKCGPIYPLGPMCLSSVPYLFAQTLSVCSPMAQPSRVSANDAPTSQAECRRLSW